MKSQTVWIVYQPQDYQRANILGAFHSKVDAQRMQNIENRRMVVANEHGSRAEIVEMPLE